MLSPEVDVIGMRPKPTFLFTGVPGIGKTFFMIYFLCRYSRDDRFADKRFVTEFSRGEYCYYRPTEVAGEYVISKQIDHDVLKNILLVCDMAESTQPAAYAKYSLVFSSPNPRRYKQFIRNSHGITFTLPTWTEKELCALVPRTVIWYDRFVKFGGVPQLIFWPRGFTVEMFDHEIAAKGEAIATEFAKLCCFSIDSESSCLLVHINPPRAANGRYMYSDLPVESFASDYVIRKLCSLHGKSIFAKAAALFNTGRYLRFLEFQANTVGYIFEKLCLWLTPVAGSTITCKALHANMVPLVLSVPNAKTLDSKWNDNGICLMSGVLYQLSNMEAGHAFSIQLVNGEYALIVLQMTVAEVHPMKADGLSYIYNAYPKAISKLITRKIIIFVTPVDGKLRNKQPIHAQNNDLFVSACDIPSGVDDFEQWVYHHHL